MSSKNRPRIFVWVSQEVAAKRKVLLWITKQLRQCESVTVYIAHDILNIEIWVGQKVNTHPQLHIMRYIKLNPRTGALTVLTHRPVYGPQHANPAGVLRESMQDLKLNKIFILTKKKALQKLQQRLENVEEVTALGF